MGVHYFAFNILITLFIFQITVPLLHGAGPHQVEPDKQGAISSTKSTFVDVTDPDDQRSSPDGLLNPDVLTLKSTRPLPIPLELFENNERFSNIKAPLASATDDTVSGLQSDDEDIKDNYIYAEDKGAGNEQITTTESDLFGSITEASVIDEGESEMEVSVNENEENMNQADGQIAPPPFNKLNTITTTTLVYTTTTDADE